MNTQYETYALSSFLLYLDNRICSTTGFYNVSSKAYKMPQTINGYNVWSFPFGQIVADTSINGINKCTGVYVNGSYISVGQSGLSGINFDKSQIYFDPNHSPVINSVSGYYSVKEVNTSLADFPDVTVLFETKMPIRSKVDIQPTGIQNNALTYPVAFIENVASPSNTPWMIGGVDQTRTIFNIYFFGDSLYQKANFTSLCKDMAWKYIPLISNISDFPMNNMGYYKNNNLYDYNNLTANRIASGRAMLVEDVTITDFGKAGIVKDIKAMTTDSYFSLITVTAWTARVTK